MVCSALTRPLHFLAILCVCVSHAEYVQRSDDPSPMSAVIDKLTTTVLQLQTELDVQKNKIEQQERDITALKAAGTLAVAFTAYISDEPHVQASKGSSVPFHGLITNIGGGYNPVTSAFTVNFPGQYFFIVHADCSANYEKIRVLVNGNAAFSADNDGLDRHVTGSALLTLQNGDVVTSVHYSDSGYLDAGIESTFTGFLVK